MTELNRLIKKGESKTVEFKETLPNENNIAKTIIAFSNMAGGKIIIGITMKTTTKTTMKTIKETQKDMTVNGFDPLKIYDETTKETPGITMKTTTKTTMKTTIKIHHKLLEIIKKNPSISLPELATQMHLTKDGIWYHLKILKNEGMLKRIGPTKGGYWIIDNKEP